MSSERAISPTPRLMHSSEGLHVHSRRADLQAVGLRDGAVGALRGRELDEAVAARAAGAASDLASHDMCRFSCSDSVGRSDSAVNDPYHLIQIIGCILSFRR